MKKKDLEDTIADVFDSVDKAQEAEKDDNLAAWFFIIGALLAGFSIYSITGIEYRLDKTQELSKGLRMTYVVGGAFGFGLLLSFLRKFIMNAIAIGIIIFIGYWLYQKM